MMAMTKVSIIIPVYNTENYLGKCLDSLVNQTLQEIEIICVNDGSTDNSLKVLEDYASRDERVKIINQENLKQGCARNNGFRIATGEYIGYVDSDDWVDLGFYEKLYNAAKKYDFDIALATNIRVGNGKTKKRIEINEEKTAVSIQDKIDLCKQFGNECPTNKIYRKSLLADNQIYWPEGVFCEDKIYTLKALYNANGVVTVPDVNYYYFRRPNSTVKGKTKKASVDKNNARKEVIEFLRKNCPEVRDREIWAVKSEKKLWGITLWRVKESLRTEKFYLFGVLRCFIRSVNS